ncbi:hypothetical protein L9F63_016710, partial [Diploptera punctata]
VNMNPNTSCPEENVVLRVSHQDITVRWPQTIATPTDMSNSIDEDDLFAGVVSEPLCLSASLEPVTRRCLQKGTSGVWLPKEPPLCPGGVQKTLESHKTCPPPFTQISTSEENSLCVFISDPQRWQPLCVKYGVTTSILDLKFQNIKLLKELMRAKGVRNVWLPAKRFQQFGPIINMLPGNKWGSKFINDTNIPSHFKLSKFWSLRNDCLSLRIKDLILETNNCNMHLPILCIFTKRNETSLVKLSYANDYFSPKYDIKNTRRCYKIYSNLSYSISWKKAEEICSTEINGHLMSFDSEYDIDIFLEMTKLTVLDNTTICWIGLMKDTKEGYTWKTNNSTKKASFVNWDTSYISYFNYGTRGVIYPNGKWKLVPRFATLKCFVCEASSDFMEADISLKYNPLYKGVIVNVYWPKGLWRESINDIGFKCFTDALGNNLHVLDIEEIWSKQWTTDDIQMLGYIRNNTVNSNFKFYIQKIVYNMPLVNNYSGNYWCEGHKVFNFDLEKSNEILVRSEEKHKYSLILDVHDNCDQGKNMVKCDPTFSNILNRVADDLLIDLSGKHVTGVRAIRILDIFNNGTLRVLFRIISKHAIKLSNISFFHVSYIGKNLGEDYVQRYTFISLLNTEFCLADVTYLHSKILRWKSTAIGTTAVSAELCIDENGIPVHRKCVGDFTFGATWLPPSGKCHNKNITSTSQSLHSLALISVDYEDWDIAEIAAKTVNLVSNPLSLGSADVYFVAMILKNIADSKSKELSLTLMTTVIRIVDQLQMARSECIHLSQTIFNSTNILLDSFEAITKKITTSTSFKKKGFYLAVSSQIILQISDPSVSNVSGLIIKRNSNSKQFTESFEDYNAVPIEINDTRTELWLDLEKADIAVWVPESIISAIQEEIDFNPENSKSEELKRFCYYAKENRLFDPKIVIAVFYDDLVFHNATKVSSICYETSIDGEYKEAYNSKNTIEEDIYDDPTVVTRVVSVSIPGYDSDLPAPIPIIFKPLVNMNTSMGTKQRKCAFWDFAYNSSTPSSSYGGWSEEGCVYVGNSSIEGEDYVNISYLHNVIDVCVCTHLTHFSEIVSGGEGRSTVAYGYYETDDNHMRALDIITIVGCSLSLAGLLGIVITAMVFKSWRQKPGTKILLQLSLALGIQMVIFILTSADVVSSTYEIDEDECIQSRLPTVNTELLSTNYEITSESQYLIYDANEGEICTVHQNRSPCIIIGALLHYSVLSAFAWMLITALLQFFRYVRVLGVTRPPRFFLKAMILGWGVPIVPVVLVLVLSPSCYIPSSPDSTLLCYPSGYPLYLTILAPVGVIVAINLIVYVMIIYNIMKITDRKNSEDGGCSLVFQQIRLGVILFFLLGLSWVFGLMGAVGAGITFSYLFCITGTLQGFVLFIFFVICDPTTRHLWTNAIS